MRTLLWILAAALAFQQDAPPPGTITGRVVDRSTGAAIPRAIVIITGTRDFTPIEKVTSADGRFEFAGLRAGRYDVQALAGEFKATHVPWATTAPSRFLELKAGETRVVSIALDRSLAISGRVVDEAGLPLARVRIRVRNLTTGADHYAGGETASDDLGAFRAYGLPAGRYIVCAEGNLAPTFDAVTGTSPFRFVRTCYPSSLDEDGGEPVVLRDAEIDGLQITMRRSRTLTVKGVVIDSSGAPAPEADLTLMRIERNGASGSTRRLQSSAFTISNVVPGHYRVTAEIGREPSGMSPESAPAEMGSVPLEITSEDVEELVVTTRKPVSVRGVVVFEDGFPPDAVTRNLRIGPQPIDRGPPFGRTRPVDVRPDLTFEVKDLFGSSLLTVQGLPAGYAVRSVRYRGQDISDVPTDFDGDARNTVEIVVTRRVAEVSGRVLDERGDPVHGARLHIFPVDPARWRGWMRGSLSSSDAGVFRIRNMAPGDYLVVAISQQDQLEINGADWYRPHPYERLATIAERITLLDGDRRTADLRLMPIPQEWKR